jgi:hypothetical protein
MISPRKNQSQSHKQHGFDDEIDYASEIRLISSTQLLQIIQSAGWQVPQHLTALPAPTVGMVSVYYLFETGATATATTPATATCNGWAVRLHDPNERNTEWIEFELALLPILQQHGLPVPRAIASQTGQTLLRFSHTLSSQYQHLQTELTGVVFEREIGSILMGDVSVVHLDPIAHFLARLHRLSEGTDGALAHDMRCGLATSLPTRL